MFNLSKYSWPALSARSIYRWMLDNHVLYITAVARDFFNKDTLVVPTSDLI